MTRQATPDTPLDDLEDRTLYIRSAVKADPDAADLLPLTDTWLSMIAAVRPKAFAAREAREEATALRRVTNARLDASCERFADDLYLACDKDRKSTRWIRFFSNAVSRFVRQPLSAQVSAVRNWLGVTGDATLDAHRQPLDTWSAAASAAVEKTRATAIVTVEARLAREALAEDLTRAQDGLEEALRVRSRERNLGRDWPKLFFPVASRADVTSEEPVLPVQTPSS